jgi:hypothetical protein
LIIVYGSHHEHLAHRFTSELYVSVFKYQQLIEAQSRFFNFKMVYSIYATLVHHFIDGTIFLLILSPIQYLFDGVAIHDHFLILNWEEFFLIEVIFIQKKLLSVVRMINNYLWKHVANFWILKFNMSFILYENSKLRPINKVVHLLQLIMSICIEKYFKFWLVLVSIARHK